MVNAMNHPACSFIAYLWISEFDNSRRDDCLYSDAKFAKHRASEDLSKK